MNAQYRGGPDGIHVNSIHRAGLGAFSAMDTSFFLEKDSAAGPLAQGFSGTGCGTCSRITGQADSGLKSGAYPARGSDMDARSFPGQ